MNAMYTRVMIIVWKWSALEGKIGNKVFDTFETTGKSKDLIIRIKELKSPEALKRIYGIVKKYQKAKILLLLHREHNYTDDDLNIILKNAPREFQFWIKCFLFTGGTDFIYYSTQNEGLLDGEGDFMNGGYRKKYIDENGKTKYEPSKFVSVVLEDEKKVLDRHFERVWVHYEFEFKKKISKLKVDFLSYFVEVPCKNNNEKLIYSKDWIDRLQKNLKLYLRIRSFLGIYNWDTFAKIDNKFSTKHIKEIKQLQRIEKADQFSYHFDDCNVNLKKMTNKKSEEAYRQFCCKLTRILIEEKQDSKAGISLVKIQALFDNVLKTLN